MTCTYFIAYRYETRGHVTDGNAVLEEIEPIVTEQQLRQLEAALARGKGVVAPSSLGVVNIVLLDRRD